MKNYLKTFLMVLILSCFTLSSAVAKGKEEEKVITSTIVRKGTFLSECNYTHVSGTTLIFKNGDVGYFIDYRLSVRYACGRGVHLESFACALKEGDTVMYKKDSKCNITLIKLVSTGAQ